MFGLTDKIISAIAGGIALLLAAALTWQTYQLSSERTAHSALKLEVSQANERRTKAALGAEVKTAKAESTHARTTQENSDAFTISQPVRDAIARADLARVDRLRLGAERRAATNRAIAQSCAAASGDIADRLEALDRHIVRGAGVVAGLGSALERRDAEVVLLRGQIDADRALLGGAQ
jgi:hypothetical protein